MSPEAARLAASRRFGNPAAAAERFYESRRLLWLDHPWQDVRSAARNLAKCPVACAVAVMWETLFDRRPDAVGAAIWIDNQPHVVGGVMPERFWFSAMDAPIWTPLDDAAVSSEAGLDVVIRREPGVTPERLARRLQGGLQEYAGHLPAAERQLRLKVSGLEGTPLGQGVSLSLPWVLGTSVLLTLLIACANVAIQVIAQWTAREHETAIRASLGASRGRIVRALVTESLLIAGIGGLLGISTTVALLGVIVHNAGESVRFFDLSIDPAILIDSVIITLVTGVVSGIGPTLLETRRLHGNPMRTMSSSDRVRQRWRHALVVMEIAVTVALLVVTATLLDGYRRSFTADVGYRMRRSKELAVRVAIGATGRDLVRLVTAHSLRLVALGTFCGVGATFALTRVARAAGGSGNVFDPDWPAFAVPVAIILVIGALATWLPSRRALTINPAILLRTT